MIVPSHRRPPARIGEARALSLLNCSRASRRANPEYLRVLAVPARGPYVAGRAGCAALRDLALPPPGYEALTLLWPQGVPLAERGMLVLCRTGHALREARESARMAQRLGMPVEIIDREAATALEPGLEMTITGAVRYPLDAHTVPQRVVATLIAGLAEAGVGLHWNTEATALRLTGTRVAAVTTTAGEIGGDEFVIAGGMWSAALARDIGLALPLMSGKGYSFTLTKPRLLPRACALLDEARIAVTPMGETLRFAGTMESRTDRSIDQRRVAAMIDAIPGYYPQFGPADFAGITPWAGLRPCSPDGLPCIGRTRRADNVLVATGHAMMGLSLAPATGRVISDLVAGREPAVPITLFSPDRFS